ncbi:hypothetical protein MMC25_006537 [Agyrium rufum]|nr:hypothetical protein [Agyrium rufum]
MTRAREEDVPLEELTVPGRVEETGSRDIGEDGINTDAASSSRQRAESGRKRACVLAGSAILQMPIWGFAMSYGVFQEYYSGNEQSALHGKRDLTGIIGTTSNGVIYLAMPFLFALFTRRWARRRQAAALCGTVLTCLSFLLSSFSTEVWHLVATQGVMAALGCALIYSPTTLSLGEWFNTSHRAVAYGVVLSCKNIVGSTCPFLFRALLTICGAPTTLRIWAGLTAAMSILAIFLIPTHPSSLVPYHENTGSSNNDLNDNDNNETTTNPGTRSREIPWSFLHHRTIYIYLIAITLQSSGYGIPQTYLTTYAHEVTALSQTSATLLLTLFNIPGIASSAFFGYLSDNKHMQLSATTVTFISALSSALSAFLFWGLTSRGSMALLVLFSMTFGCFAGGYSGTWGGIINELEREAAAYNEAIDTGMLYGLLNGARGIGYVSGGLAGVPLLKAGATAAARTAATGGKGGLRGFGYGTSYGPLIVFTGLSTVFGGWGVLWKGKGLWRRLRM